MRLYLKQTLIPLLITTLAVGCAAPDDESISNLEWVPSGTETAILQQKDLDDDFALQMNIIKVTGGLPADLVNLGLQTDVQLQGLNHESGLLLAVVGEEGGSPLLTFGLNETAQGYVIDFATPTNYVSLDAAVTERNASWTQDKDYIRASVKRLDEDTIETDLVFRFQNGTDTGLMLVAVSLSRKLVVPNQPGFVPRTIAEGFAKNVGFFDENKYAKRYPIPQDGNNIVFYIENYPVEMQQDAIKAIESWNEVFDEDIIEARVAPQGVHYGDRKYNVVKWFNEDVGGFTGRASPVYANASGQVYSGNVQINGGFIKAAQTRIGESQNAYRRLRQTNATIGGKPFDVMPGEQPFVPFYIGHDDQKTITAVHRMYYDTLVHEIGHVLGLRHNFRGSVAPDSGTDSASVMDYGPRAESNFGPSSPGSYDRKAIRWGYYGEEPGDVLFCTDDDIEKNWDCNQADWGNPVRYINSSIVGAMEFIKVYDQEVSSQFLNSTKTFTGMYVKFAKLGVPAAETKVLNQQVKPNFKKLLQGNLGLSGVKKKNLDKLRKIANDHLQCLATQEAWKC
jgi:hypothetical protein